jgi:hypothetical protein
MSGKRQKTQDSLALAPNSRGETRAVGSPRAEPLMAKPAPESPAVTEQLMEEVCDRENLQSAWKRVQRNQGSPGVDGIHPFCPTLASSLHEGSIVNSVLACGASVFGCTITCSPLGPGRSCIAATAASPYMRSE